MISINSWCWCHAKSLDILKGVSIFQELVQNSQMSDEDIMKTSWNCFPHIWPFLRKIHITGPLWVESTTSLGFCDRNPLVTGKFPSQKASDVVLWYFICCQPLTQAVKLLVICDALRLKWYHCNGKQCRGIILAQSMCLHCHNLVLSPRK